MKNAFLSFIAAALGVLAISLPSQALACACGCDVFDVGSSALLPSGHGQGSIFAEYDYMDQTHNWSGHSGSPSVNNDDKEIRSNFFLVGAQYMFHCGFGLMVEAPVTQRFFKTTDDDTGLIDHFSHTAFGDLRLMGVYSGFSPDMSTGIIFGAKLPTGDFKYSGFDRDTEIGSGSTDLLLGAYHRGALGNIENWSYYAQVLWQAPMAYQDGYRPGQDVNGALGVVYSGFGNAAGTLKVAPVLQLIASTRTKDGGPNADPPDSGYERLMVSPGVQIDIKDLRLYADIEVPVYQRVNGNQLVAPALYKFIVSKSF